MLNNLALLSILPQCTKMHTVIHTLHKRLSVETTYSSRTVCLTTITDSCYTTHHCSKNSEVTVVALLIPHSICSLRISLQTNRLENGAINQFLIHFSTTTSNTASYLQLSLSQVNETSYSKGLKRDFIASWEHLHEAWKGREEWAAPEGITQACSSQRNANFMRASSQWEGQHSICTLFYFHFH